MLHSQIPLRASASWGDKPCGVAETTLNHQLGLSLCYVQATGVALFNGANQESGVIYVKFLILEKLPSEIQSRVFSYLSIVVHLYVLVPQWQGNTVMSFFNSS